jgi:uncharacterized protein HemX
MAAEKKSAFNEQRASSAASSKLSIFKNKKKYLIIAGSILTVIVIVGVGLFYFNYQKSQQLKNNPTLAAKNEEQTVIAKIGQLMELPTGEQPEMATVTDFTKLQSQPFFQGAKDGDILLVYTKAKEAILYDPGTNKIVRVGPINTTPQETANAASNTGSAGSGSNPAVAGASTTAGSQPLTVAVYNGTTIVGLASKTSDEIEKKMSNMRVVEETNASSTSYTQTKVIDLSGNNAQAAKQLATLLNGTVGSLPKGEVKPPSVVDLLVILGSE